MRNLTWYALIVIYIGFTTAGQSQKINVVSSCSIFADMTENIAGDLVNLKSIVPIGGDPHTYSPTPQNARIVEKANLILINGLTFEGWIEELIENSGTAGKTVLITAGVKPLKSQQYENSSDPHAWMTAKNGLIYIENIKNALVAADPANRETYEKNHAAYLETLTALHTEIQNEIAKIPKEKRILITSHDAFSYFGQEYGLKVEPILGVSTEADVQTSDMIRVAKAIKDNQVPAVFVESTINPKILQQIAQDNDIVVGGELFADSLGDSESEGDTYVNMLRHNAQTIAKALSVKVDDPAAASSERIVSDERANWRSILTPFFLGLIAAIVFGIYLKLKAKRG